MMNNEPLSHSSRRAFLRGAVATGVAAAGAGLLLSSARAEDVDPDLGTSPDSVKTIFSVSRTAEQLAVTFYTNGVKNAAAMGIDGDNLTYLKAALIEEQIHQQFFTAAGGDSLADTFSFPDGAKTFSDLSTFIATQQILEGVFDSAFLAAVREFAQLGHARAAQIAAQIMAVECEHLALGRVIGGYALGDPYGYQPVLLKSVGDAPGVVAKAGFLSPKEGNSYKYQEIDFQSGEYAAIYDKIRYKAPYTVLEMH